MALISLSVFIFMNVFVGLLHALVALEKSIFSDPRKAPPHGKDCGNSAESGVNMPLKKTSQKAKKLVKAAVDVSCNNQYEAAAACTKVFVEPAIVGPKKSPDVDAAAAAKVAATLLATPQVTASQPRVKCATLKKLEQRPRDGRTVVNVSKTKLQKPLKRSFASDDSEEQRPKKAKLHHEAYIRVARKAPTSLNREGFKVEPPLLSIFLGRKAGEDVARPRNKRSEFLIQREAERDSLSSDLFEIMIEAVDESITGEKELAQLSAQRTRNMWLLRVALAERLTEYERLSAGEELLDEEEDDEYFFDRDDIEEMKERVKIYDEALADLDAEHAKKRAEAERCFFGLYD